MIVRIVRDWKYPDIMRQTPGKSGEWDGIKFTEEQLDYCDVLIVLNRPYEKINCRIRKGGAWLFSQESPIPLYNWHKAVFPYFDNVYTFWDNLKISGTTIIHDQTSLPWHVDKTYDELKALQPGNDKKNEVSWVTSNATNKEGHKLRMSFLDYLKAENYPLHLYGRGFEPIADKFDGLFPFQYSIAVENYSCNDYWTEKLADCLLSWTLPFYYGAKNITSYFPEDALIPIDPNDSKKSLEIIRQAIQNNEWEKRLPAIEKARNMILDQYQFFPAVAKKIREAKLSSATSRRLIPACTPEGLSDFTMREKIRTQIVNFLRK